MAVQKKERLCDECGEPIPPARLKVLPETKLCVECAEDLEAEMKSRHGRGELEFGGAEGDDEGMADTLRDLTES